MTGPANELAALRDRIAAATGSDAALDREIARLLDPGEPGDNPGGGYSGSVDACVALIGRAAPDWHWHVGHGPSGVLPYAALTRDGPEETRMEAVAPTVPLALLRALVDAVMGERGEAGS